MPLSRKILMGAVGQQVASDPLTPDLGWVCNEGLDNTAKTWSPKWGSMVLESPSNVWGGGANSGTDGYLLDNYQETLQTVEDFAADFAIKHVFIRADNYSNPGVSFWDTAGGLMFSSDNASNAFWYSGSGVRQYYGGSTLWTRQGAGLNIKRLLRVDFGEDYPVSFTETTGVNPTGGSNMSAGTGTYDGHWRVPGGTKLRIGRAASGGTLVFLYYKEVRLYTHRLTNEQAAAVATDMLTRWP